MQTTNSKQQITKVMWYGLRNMIFFLFVTCYMLYVTCFPVFAATGSSLVNPDLSNKIRTNTNAATTPFSSKDLTTVIGIVINSILGILGVIFLILIIYAGFRWLMAKGVDTDITKARNLIENSIIGLIIVVGCFVIVKFVLGALQKFYT